MFKSICFDLNRHNSFKVLLILKFHESISNKSETVTDLNKDLMYSRDPRWLIATAILLKLFFLTSFFYLLYFFI